jgi:hypothetical protein
MRHLPQQPVRAVHRVPGDRMKREGWVGRGGGVVMARPRVPGPAPGSAGWKSSPLCALGERERGAGRPLSRAPGPPGVSVAPCWQILFALARVAAPRRWSCVALSIPIHPFEIGLEKTSAPLSLPTRPLRCRSAPSASSPRLGRESEMGPGRFSTHAFSLTPSFSLISSSGQPHRRRGPPGPVDRVGQLRPRFPSGLHPALAEDAVRLPAVQPGVGLRQD